MIRRVKITLTHDLLHTVVGAAAGGGRPGLPEPKKIKQPQKLGKNVQ